MALGVFIAGAYGAVRGGVAVGLTDDGWNLQWEPKSEAIDKSDAYGDMLLDMVWRGCNWFVQAELLEYKPGSIDAAYPWGTMGQPGIIARLASDVAGALVLTSTAGTPAAATPATLTANKSILAPGFNVDAVYSSRLRTMPCRLALLPYEASGTKSFTLT